MEILCKEVKPYVPLNMHEICFWLRIMKEHALFIRLGLPCDQRELIEEAKCFQKLFADFEKQAGRVTCDGDFAEFVGAVAVAVQNLFCFKRHLLQLLIECRIRGGANYPLLIDHISREALYFCKLLKKIKGGAMEYPVDAIVAENVFWIRIMAEHARFIRGLVDPSEREAFDKAQAFSDQFDRLNLHARDLESMLWHLRPNNDLVKFTDTVTEATCKLRDFKATAEQLIKDCQALTLIPPLLADHVRREAEHFLEILALIRSDLAQCPSGPIIHCG
jgi:hypothetical protein